MDFSLNEEQLILADMTRRYLRANHTPGQRVDRATEEAMWQGIHGELGLVGAPFPESLGGFGGGDVEAMIIAQALGESLVPVPFLEAVIMAGSVLQESEAPAARNALSDMLENGQRVAFCHWETRARYEPLFVETVATQSENGWVINGCKDLIVGAQVASNLIVTARVSARDAAHDGLAMFLINPAQAGVTMRAVQLLDERPCADIRLEEVRVGEDSIIAMPGKAEPMILTALDRGVAALCSEAVGVLQAMLEQTLDYTRQRTQFGQPLSRFQALQHRMVDMFMHVEQARAAALLATLKLGSEALAREQAVSAAKSVINDALLHVGQNAVQLHGAMGLTDELAVSHYFKRAMVIRDQLGASDFHLSRYARNTLRQMAV